VVKYKCDEKLGVRTISKAKEDVMKLFEAGEDLTLDMSALKRIDMSVGQFAIAVQKEGKRRGIAVRLSGTASRVKHQLALCGAVKWGGDE
jgi:anti-anti-sigma regulatory factor